jgi:hypothetical protein
MNRKPFAAVLAMLLVVAIVAPSVLFIAPQRASAASSISCVGGLLGLEAASVVEEIVAVPVSDVVDQTANNLGGGASIGSCINDVILIPLARAAIRMILQKMTASVINWINGSNGTGQPSYVQNLQGHLQGVGDTQALAFFAQFGRNSNSPFANAIISSLRVNYLQNTSAAGFWAANRNTLAQFSPNVNNFLAGNWSQGGVGAWFALTTQNQNNPYTLYQASQSQLASLVGGAQAARAATLSFGQGFLSWCGVNDAAAQTQGSAATAYQNCQANGGTGDQCQAVFNQSGGTMPSGGGVNPGDACTNGDGTPGKILTPGSVIHDYTQKAVVASGFDQLISANDLDNAFTAVITALLNKVLGSVGGLFGASSGGSGSVTRQLQNYSPSGNSTATQAASQTAQTVLTQLAAYTGAWNTISTAANTASANVTDLANVCTATAGTVGADPTLVSTATTIAGMAQTALTTEITPVLSRAQVVSGVAATTRAFALKVQAEASGTNVSTSLAADVSTLVAMPPSATDLGNAQSGASVTNAAVAIPQSISPSLQVSGGSLVDQMNLISTNATKLKVTCAPSIGSGSPGGG